MGIFLTLIILVSSFLTFSTIMTIREAIMIRRYKKLKTMVEEKGEIIQSIRNSVQDPKAKRIAFIIWKYEEFYKGNMDYTKYDQLQSINKSLDEDFKDELKSYNREKRLKQLLGEA